MGARGEPEESRVNHVAPGELVTISDQHRDKSYGSFPLLNVHPNNAAYIEAQNGVPILIHVGHFREGSVGMALASYDDFTCVAVERLIGWIATDRLLRI